MNCLNMGLVLHTLDLFGGQLIVSLVNQIKAEEVPEAWQRIVV